MAQTTCLIKLKEGSLVEIISDKRVGVIKSITLMPNGMNDFSLVAVVTVKLDSGNVFQATANKFKPVDSVTYEEYYPSVELINTK